MQPADRCRAVCRAGHPGGGGSRAPRTLAQSMSRWTVSCGSCCSASSARSAPAARASAVRPLRAPLCSRCGSSTRARLPQGAGVSRSPAPDSRPCCAAWRRFEEYKGQQAEDGGDGAAWSAREPHSSAQVRRRCCALALRLRAGGSHARATGAARAAWGGYAASDRMWGPPELLSHACAMRQTLDRYSMSRVFGLCVCTPGQPLHAGATVSCEAVCAWLCHLRPLGAGSSGSGAWRAARARRRRGVPARRRLRRRRVWRLRLCQLCGHGLRPRGQQLGL